MNIPTFQKIHEVAHDLAFQDEGATLREWVCSEDTDRHLAVAFQAGKLNYQVENGGFLQYFDNGYADGKSGCMDDAREKADIECHHALIKDLAAFKDQIVTNSEEEVLFNDAMNIFNKFAHELWIDEDVHYEETCSTCCGDGELEDEDDEGQVTEVPCPDCGGEGWFTEYNDNYGCIGEGVQYGWSRLDDRYYMINKEWMELLDRFFQKVVAEKPELIATMN